MCLEVRPWFGNFGGDVTPRLGWSGKSLIGGGDLGWGSELCLEPHVKVPTSSPDIVLRGERFEYVIIGEC